jgi:hypothetical protein
MSKLPAVHRPGKMPRQCRPRAQARRLLLAAHLLDYGIQPVLQRRPAAFAEADELLARWTEAVAARPGGRDTRPAWAMRYWHKRNTKAGLPGQTALHATAPAAS